MTQLEPEFDYQTDQDLVSKSKDLLQSDLYSAVHFYMTADPLLFV